MSEIALSNSIFRDAESSASAPNSRSTSSHSSESGSLDLGYESDGISILASSPSRGSNASLSSENLASQLSVLQVAESPNAASAHSSDLEEVRNSEPQDPGIDADAVISAGGEVKAPEQSSADKLRAAFRTLGPDAPEFVDLRELVSSILHLAIDEKDADVDEAFGSLDPIVNANDIRSLNQLMECATRPPEDSGRIRDMSL
jgi:Ca2+-binding EF-hand superfamily protein